jgi:outer membrane protein OmpA-like peptidoglycan-associated protein
MTRRGLAALPFLLAAPPVALAQPRGAPAPPLALPAGMAPLPQGAYRVLFRAGAQDLPGGVAPTLAELGRRLAAMPAGSGRITVEGHASGPANDPSTARRVALARANAVRAALVAGGLDETRVDVRALGRTPAALDAADVLPPGVVRTGQTR